MTRPSIALLLLVSLFACGASDKQKTLKGTFETVSAVRREFVVEDRRRQTQIATVVPIDGVDEALRKYRKKRDTVAEAFVAAYAAIAAAAVADDGVQAALDAAAVVYRTYREWKASP